MTIWASLSLLSPQRVSIYTCQSNCQFHLKKIETPVRQIHQKIARYLDEKIAILDPEEIIKREK
jgi:hypothetical protein